VTIESVCVFCGSRRGARPAFEAAAGAFGREVATRGFTLVTGGGRVGLMKTVADAALDAGGQVIGVIPRFLQDREVAHQGLTRLEVVETMHARKARMAELGDGFVALPGGLGTLEELFELWTAGLLGLHQKPCGLLDVDGYWRPLLAQIARMVEEDFVALEHHDYLVVDDDPARLLDRLAAAAPPPAAKWTKVERF
jgi:uncharacterized protein (TIGR00730 family)